MFINRRIVNLSLLSAFSLGFCSQASAQSPPHPNRKLFQSGDFLWPRVRDHYVPYNAGSPNSFEADRIQWEKEREAFLKAVAGVPLTPQQEQFVRGVRNLTFREFQRDFTGSTPPDEPLLFAFGRLSVGHVAIVDIDAQGRIWIIEAMPDVGVQRLSYDAWVAARLKQLIWHGRLRQRDRSVRAAIAVQARRLIGKPYNIWNLALDDESEFYCSKLAWLCTLRATEVALDGETSPRRWRWVSPKQILYAESISRLHSPGDYGRAIE